MLTLKGKINDQKISVQPSLTPVPTVVLQPTPTVSVSADNELSNLKKMTPTDEIIDIVRDAANTSFKGLEQSLSELSGKQQFN